MLGLGGQTSFSLVQQASINKTFFFKYFSDNMDTFFNYFYICVAMAHASCPERVHIQRAHKSHGYRAIV